MERALSGKRVAKWRAKPPVETSPLFRKGGAGQTALCRLFYGLGWTKGEQKTLYGNLFDAETARLLAVKKKLTLLARKYDDAAREY